VFKNSWCLTVSDSIKATMITGTDNTGMDTLYTWGTPEKQT